MENCQIGNVSKECKSRLVLFQPVVWQEGSLTRIRLLLRETKLWWSARWAGDHPGPCLLLPLLSHLHQDWRVQEGSIFIWIPRSVKRPIWFRTLPPMQPSCCCLTRRPLSRHFTQPRWKTTQFNWESTGINLHLETFLRVLLCQTWIISIYSFEFALFSLN